MSCDFPSLDIIIYYTWDLPVRGPKKFRYRNRSFTILCSFQLSAPRAPWKLVELSKKTLGKLHLEYLPSLRLSPLFFPNKSFSPNFLRIQTWRFDSRIIHLSVDPWSTSRNLLNLTNQRWERFGSCQKDNCCCRN